MVSDIWAFQNRVEPRPQKYAFQFLVTDRCGCVEIRGLKAQKPVVPKQTKISVEALECQPAFNIKQAPTFSPQEEQCTYLIQ